MFTQEDNAGMKARGMDLDTVHRQIDHFVAGFPYIKLVRPATVSDGIIRFDDEQSQFLQKYFDKKLPGLKVVKFVPASGAASRMFKHLFEFLQFSSKTSKYETLTNDVGFNSVHYFLTHLGAIAFFEDLSSVLATRGKHIDQLLHDQDYDTIIDAVLSPEGLNYANLPKALLKFHRYGNDSRTAAEEHLVEAALYTRDHNNIARIHFTISPEHHLKFNELFDKVKSRYESEFRLNFDISYSIQKPSTDTIAVDVDNQPLRNPDGTLLFRPGGHGALLENLNEIEADLIFIKNIDNIVPDNLKDTTVAFKKLLGGYLLFVKETISGMLLQLNDQSADRDALHDMSAYAAEKLFLDIPADFDTYSVPQQSDLLLKLLNRPIRVCGMVRNEGEPGGGPFWVMGHDQRLSLQIVESSQIDLQDPSQRAIVDQATHFNPVDLVCSTTSIDMKTFNLHSFVDEETGFISRKSSGGKTLKAQELPGLWNGAMARWITIFVEVPIITFNPVKTVNDLLRSEHIPATIK